MKGDVEVIPVQLKGEGTTQLVRKAAYDSVKANYRDQAGRTDRLAGELHKLRGELDGARRSLATAERLLGAAEVRYGALDERYRRSVDLLVSHADRLDAICAAAATGEVGELALLAKEWRDRD